MPELLKRRDDLWDIGRPNLELYLRTKAKEEEKKFPRWEVVKGEKIPLFYPSSGASCRRQEWYRLMRPEAALPEEIAGAMRLHDGVPHQATVVHWLGEMGFTITDQEKSFPRLVSVKGKPLYKVRARVDGMIVAPLLDSVVTSTGIRVREKCVLEVKGIADWSFKKLVKDPLEIIHKIYRTQAQVYMYLAEVAHTIFAIKNKNTSEIALYDLKYSPEMMTKTKARWREIAESLHGEKPLDRDFDDPGCRQCQWCRFKKECWGRQAQ